MNSSSILCTLIDMFNMRTKFQKCKRIADWIIIKEVIGLYIFDMFDILCMNSSSILCTLIGMLNMRTKFQKCKRIANWIIIKEVIGLYIFDMFDIFLLAF